MVSVWRLSHLLVIFSANPSRTVAVLFVIFLIFAQQSVPCLLGALFWTILFVVAGKRNCEWCFLSCLLVAGPVERKPVGFDYVISYINVFFSIPHFCILYILS